MLADRRQSIPNGQHGECTQCPSRKVRGLTVVEGLARITEQHCGNCQQTANGDAEAVKLSRSKHTKSKQEDHSLKNSPASNSYNVERVSTAIPLCGETTRQSEARHTGVLQFSARVHEPDSLLREC